MARSVRTSRSVILPVSGRSAALIGVPAVFPFEESLGERRRGRRARIAAPARPEINVRAGRFHNRIDVQIRDFTNINSNNHLKPLLLARRNLPRRIMGMK
jgi:hypothetical protein